MADMKLSDFVQMLGTSSAIADSTPEAPEYEDLPVQLQDEDGSVYDIQDVKFDRKNRRIVVFFNHDNDE